MKLGCCMCGYFPLLLIQPNLSHPETIPSDKSVPRATMCLDVSAALGSKSSTCKSWMVTGLEWSGTSSFCSDFCKPVVLELYTFHKAALCFHASLFGVHEAQQIQGRQPGKLLDVRIGLPSIHTESWLITVVDGARFEWSGWPGFE